MKRGEKHKVEEVAKQNVRSIYNYPVVPEESPLFKERKIPSVTRKDMGTDFRNAMQFGFVFWKDSPLYDYVFYKGKMASATWPQWYNFVEVREARADETKAGIAVPGWEEGARQQAQKGLYVHAFNSLCTNRISKPHYEKMREIFGPQWMGFNEGEWDGAYFSRVAKTSPNRSRKDGKVSYIDDSMEGLSRNRSRKEACAHYLAWLGDVYARHHNYMVTVSSLGTGCHYAAELGSRMMGLELAQSIPSSAVMMTFSRGASRQYDLLMAMFPSVWGRRGSGGVKCYPREGQPQSVCLPEGALAGTDHGTTLGLLKRLWWFSYMNGSAIIGIETSYFPADLTGEYTAQTALPFKIEEPFALPKLMAHFTPVAWLIWEAKEAAIRHPYRGVPYTPVAVMLPFDHGWHPRSGYTDDREQPELPGCVWGNISKQAGDLQIDRFFEWAYPGYQFANFVNTRDERGILTNTPFGDSFDVILSNARERCLEKYQVLMLLGVWNGFTEEGLFERLEKFVAGGGTVILDAGQWHNLAQKPYKRTSSARVMEIPCEQGRFLVVTEPSWGVGNSDQSVFQSVKQEIGACLDEYTLIEIEGRPVYYLVNVTDQPDELLITVCNNSQDMDWEGTVRVKGQVITDVEEWLAYGEVCIKDGVLLCGVPANNVRVYRIRTKQPFMALRFRNIPWKKLGFGVPEWPN